MIDVLIGCEESQAICIAFRSLGFNAYSCDVQACSGGHPEWHIQGDVFDALKLREWKLFIANPPCTYLAASGEPHFNVDKYGELAIARTVKRLAAYEFFMQLWRYDIPHICLENPVGYINTHFHVRPQIIDPYYFGDRQLKRTCLWLKNLPALMHYTRDGIFHTQTHTERPEPTYLEHKPDGKVIKRYFADSITGSTDQGRKLRSKTFPGIAKAMAEQWGAFLTAKYIK